MRKLLFLSVLSLFLSVLSASAQVKTKLYVGGPLATNVYRGPLGSDSALYIGSNCGDPNTIIPKQNVGNFYGVYRGALIYKDTCNNSVWTSNPDSSWTELGNGNNTVQIDTTFNLDGLELLLTIPHGLSSTPSDVRVQVDNEAGLSSFLVPYFDATNIYIPYSVGPICTCSYKITITQ